MVLKLLDMATEFIQEAGVICIEVVGSVAGLEDASALDVVVETDMTDVLRISTAHTDVVCELWMWHDADAAEGASVVI